MILENLNKYIVYKKIPIYKFEEELGLGRGTVSKAIKKNGGISTGILENILRKYSDINIEWLVTGKGKMLKKDGDINRTHEKYPEINLYNLDLVSKLSQILAKENREAIVGTIRVPNISDCDAAAFVKGDSMTPKLLNGDIILFKKLEEETIFYGEMYILSVMLNKKEEYSTIKIINKSDKGDGWVNLSSKNTQYESQDIKIEKIKSLFIIRSVVRNNN